MIGRDSAAGRHPPARVVGVGVAGTGFRPRSEALHRLYNLILATLFTIMLLPLIVLISLALMLTQGFGIFYLGRRVGRNRREFNIIKFRTLDNAKAAKLTSAAVLPDGTGIETPLGKYLRATRLDELPQLLNVLVGDMNLCGPRPVRPEMAALYRERMPWFDARFDVKPGLVGHSQAFMSHGTSETIRERYNVLLCRKPVRYARELLLLLTVGTCVVLRGAYSLGSTLMRRLLGKRGRSMPKGPSWFGHLEVAFVGARTGRHSRVAGVDRDRLVLADKAAALDPSCVDDRGWLEITLPDGSKRRAKVLLTRRRTSMWANRTEFEYEPATDFADHLISRYLLMTVVVPHKSLLPPALVRRSLARAAVRLRPATLVDGEAASELRR
jgi:lipopolysaccharide/colanic/teichoic acid biosynthesis glycosyltransferase